MTIETRPIGLPIEEPSLATWWPRLDFAFVDADAGAMSGAATLAFTPTATALATGDLAGTATLAFTPTATALATGDLAGAATLDFTPTATALATASLAGTSVLVFTPVGSMEGPGAATRIISGLVRVQVVTESVRIQTTTHEIRVFLPRAA